MKRSFASLLFLAVLAGPLRAQTPRVLFGGRGDPVLDARIKRVLREPARRVWVNDTVLTARDTVREPLLLVGNTVKVGGLVLGDVVAIGADVFVRPSGEIRGNVLSIASGWYPSALARLPAAVESDPNAPYEVVRSADIVRIVGTVHRRAVALKPQLPTYDRVAGLSLGAGAVVLLPALGRLESQLELRGTYRSELGEIDGSAEAKLQRGGVSLSFGAGRTTLTNEEWIRGDVNNTVNYLFLGKDIRDYYEADRAWVELRGEVEHGQRNTALWVRGQVEDASSLHADHPWSLFKPDSVRPNLQVDDGRVTSVTAGTDVAWERPTFAAEIRAASELGIDLLDSDYRFSRYLTDVKFAMLALRDHTLEVEAHLRGPLIDLEDTCRDCTGPSRRIPRQRWTHVGGSGTLHTFSDAQFRGDRLVYVETRYSIPLSPRLKLAMLGIPNLDLLHITGMAWTRGQEHRLEQNVGLRLRYNVAYLRVVTNPERFTGDAEFSVGLSFPKRAYPWQASGGFF